jgi:DNA-binding Xre family transcriptional regulator
MPKQKDLARESEMYQSRISMFETPGTNITLETLSRIAAGLRCGLIVKFVRFSDMLHWENSFSPDTFNVTRLTEDEVFLDPAASHGEDAQMLVGSFPPPGNTLGSVVTFPGPSDGLKKSIENEQAGFSASAVGS